MGRSWVTTCAAVVCGGGALFEPEADLRRDLEVPDRPIDDVPPNRLDFNALDVAERDDQLCSLLVSRLAEHRDGVSDAADAHKPESLVEAAGRVVAVNAQA